MQHAKPFATMSAQERADMEKLIAGLDLGPIAAEEVVAEGHVTDFLSDLHDKMLADGVTQAELARRMHVQPNQIRRWLSTESALKANTMFLLARLMGYRIEQRWEAIAVQVSTPALLSDTYLMHADMLRDGLPGLADVTLGSEPVYAQPTMGPEQSFVLALAA